MPDTIVAQTESLQKRYRKRAIELAKWWFGEEDWENDEFIEGATKKLMDAHNAGASEGYAAAKAAPAREGEWVETLIPWAAVREALAGFTTPTKTLLGPKRPHREHFHPQADGLLYRAYSTVPLTQEQRDALALAKQKREAVQEAVAAKADL